MKKDKTYLFLLSLVYVGFVIVFCFFPRSTFSELEKRELTSFPAFTAESLADGSFTTGVNHWFSDTEPFRDFFMKTNLQQKKLMAWTFPRGDEEEVVFHATNDGAAAAEVVKTEQEKKCEGCCYAKGQPCVSACCYKDLDKWLQERRKKAGGSHE